MHVAGERQRDIPARGSGLVRARRAGARAAGRRMTRPTRLTTRSSRLSRSARAASSGRDRAEQDRDPADTAAGRPTRHLTRLWRTKGQVTRNARAPGPPARPQIPAFGDPVDASQIVYRARQGAPGGWVSTCGLWVVVRFMTSIGDPPNEPTCPGLEPSTTGCRPALAIPPSMASTTAGGAPGETHATGTPHMPLITWLKTWATRRSTMTTDDDPPIAEHSPRTASASCAPTLCCARPPAVGRRPPREPEWVRPNPNEVLTDGSSIAPTQNAPTSAAVTVPAPRSLARRVSHAAPQAASRIRPGRTTGTSLRLAHGWSGTVNGCHRTAAEPPRMTASGSAQFSPAPEASRQVSRARR